MTADSLAARVQALPQDLQRNIALRVIRCLGRDGRLMFGIHPGPLGCVALPRIARLRARCFEDYPFATIAQNAYVVVGPYIIHWSKYKSFVPSAQRRWDPFGGPFGQRIGVEPVNSTRSLYDVTCSSVHGWLESSEF